MSDTDLILDPAVREVVAAAIVDAFCKHVGEPRRWVDVAVEDRGAALKQADAAITAYLRSASPPPAEPALEDAARKLVDFAWSAVKANNEDARVYLNSLVANLRAALRPVGSPAGGAE